MIGQVLSHYEIVSKLGDGGMGVVYKARDTHLDRFVAIKVLRPETVAGVARARFAQEAKAASSLNHPGIITIHDIASADGVDFIAMEYVDGVALDELIRRRGIRLNDALNYAIQAGAALARAHDAGIVHRDVKPSNIMVTTDGRVKILDFGLAKLTTVSEPEAWAPTATMTAVGAAMTEHGKVLGTAAYMSPEQAQGRPIDARSDIFSFGAVLYELVTGVRAFQGDSSVSLLSAVQTLDPKPPSELAPNVPRELERAILRCLRKDPTRRFQHTADLVVELEDIKTESGSQVAAAAPPVRRPVRGWVAVTAGAALALSAGAAWLLQARKALALPELEAVRLTSFPGNEQSPSFSPDGRQVVFRWDGVTSTNTDLYITFTNSEGVPPHRLTTDPARDTSPVWSPTGDRIAFVRQQGALDATIYTISPLGGGERKVAEFQQPAAGLIRGGYTTISWSPDGKWLAGAGVRSDRENGIFMQPAGGGEKRWSTSTPNASDVRYLWPTFSPHGDRLAFSKCTGNFACELYVAALDANLAVVGDPQRVTHQGALFDGVAWMPDGQSIVYGASTDTGNDSHLWRVDISGSRAPERLRLVGDAKAPTVSNDGKALVYVRGNGSRDIWRFDDGRAPEPFLALSSNQYDSDAFLSPDGNRVAFVTNRSGNGTEVWVANKDGTGQNRITEGVERMRGSPRWSNDSRWLAFDGQDETGYWDIYIVDAAGGPQKLFTPSTPTSDENVPSWSRDGNWIYFSSNRTGRYEVWRAPANIDGEAQQITNAGGRAPYESSDGRRLYYTKQEIPGLFQLDLGGGGSERRLFDSVSGWSFYPVTGGVYFIARRGEREPTTLELRFWNESSGRDQLVRTFEARFGQSLSVSPDGKTILYSVAGTSVNSDLALVRNFR